MGEGDDVGLYLPTDAPWVVHRDFGTLVGGIRALLMQALHPGTLAGVVDHSRYESEPLGRLAGTIRWLTVTTFGGKSAVEKEAQRVNRLHARVTGTYTNESGRSLPYSASDSDLLLWVHLAFMESFLVAHQALCAAPIPRGDAPSPEDNYVMQWGQSVEPLGLRSVPETHTQLTEEISRFASSGQLSVSADTLRVVAFVKKPPLPVAARPIYRILFAAAVATIPVEFRQQLRLRAVPHWLVMPVTRVTLRVMRASVGTHSPIEDAALDRLRRVGAI